MNVILDLIKLSYSEDTLKKVAKSILLTKDIRDKSISQNGSMSIYGASVQACTLNNLDKDWWCTIEALVSESWEEAKKFSEELNEIKE